MRSPRDIPMHVGWVMLVWVALVLPGVLIFSPRLPPREGRFSGKSPTPSVVVGVVLVGMGLAMGTPAMVHWIVWPHADAMVVRLDHGSSGARTLIPVFHFQARGHHVIAAGSLAESPQRYHLGERAEIAWDPALPTRILPRDDRFIRFGYLGGPGIFLLLLVGLATALPRRTALER